MRQNREKKVNILLCGYYGCHNAGDDATLQAICESVRGALPQAEIAALTGEPAETARLCGCAAAARFSPRALFAALRRCDVLVFGGGSLLQDVTSSRSLLYYLALLRLARFFGKKTMLFGSGIGPVHDPANRRRVAAAVRRVDCVTLRDAGSLDTLRQMSAARPDFTVTADPVFALHRADPALAQPLLAAAGLPAGAAYLAVSVRNWPGVDAFCTQAAAALDEICTARGLHVLFVTMHPEYDREPAEKIAAQMRSPTYFLPETGIDGLMAAIGGAQAVLSMRLHAMIFAARMGVPGAGIVYDPKMESFLARMDMPSCGDVAGFTAQRAVDALNRVLDARAAFVRHMQAKNAALEKLAAENAAALKRLVCGEGEKK